MNNDKRIGSNHRRYRKESSILCLKDGRMLIGQTDNRIIKNIMAEFVQFAEVKPELIDEVKLKDIVR